MKLQLMTILGSIGGGGDVKPLEEEIERLTQELQQAYEDLSELQRQKDILEAQYGEALDQIQEQQTAIANYVHQIQALNEQIQNLGRQISELNRDLDTLRMALDAKDRELEEKDGEIGELTAQVTELQTQVTELQTQVQTLSAQISALQLEIQQKDEYIAYLEEHQGGGDGMYIEDGVLKGKLCNTFDVTSVGLGADASELTNGSNMFYNCSNLTSFESDLPALTNGSSMFYGCSNLTSFSGDLPSVTNVANMFYSCTNLTSFSADMPSLSSARNMFSGRSNLTSFSGDLSSLTDGHFMFNLAYNLEEFNTSNLDNLENGIGMFSCVSYYSFPPRGKITHWEIPLPKLKYGGWYNGLSDYDGGSHGMFCYQGLTNWDIELPSLEYGTEMFYKCNLEHFNVAELPSLTEGGRGSNQYGMFQDTKIDTFTTSMPQIRWGRKMFANCQRLNSFTSDLSILEDGWQMFSNCTSLTSWDIALPALTFGSQMFERCRALTSWTVDLHALTTGTNMFDNCEKMTSFTGDLSSLTGGNYMFQYCVKLTTFVSTLPALTTGTSMFYNCRLSHASVKRIADSINDLASKGKTGSIYIGVNRDSLPEDKQAEYNAQIVTKGWTVTWQRNAAPAGWTPDQDEPVDEPDGGITTNQVTPQYIDEQLNAGKEIVFTLNGDTEYNSWTFVGDATEEADAQDKETYGVTYLYNGVNPDNVTGEMHLTIWKDSDGNIQLETYAHPLDSDKLISVPIRTEAESYYADFGIHVPGAMVGYFKLSIASDGMSIETENVAPLITSVTVQDATEHDPAKWGDDPEEPTDGITIPADAVKVGTYTYGVDNAILSELTSQDVVDSINNGSKVLYTKYYDFQYSSGETTQWYKVNINGENIDEAVNIEYTDEAVDYVVARFTKADSSDPDSLIVASSTDFGSFNGGANIPGSWGGSTDVSSFFASFSDYSGGGYESITMMATVLYIDGESHPVTAKHADFYLADS